MNIPFVDLKAQYNSIKEDIDKSIKSVIDKTSFIKGEFVSNFEREYAKEYGVKNCIGCGNGTDAIYIALKSLNIGNGDEVITVANTWISTSETISQTGAKPVFIDIDSRLYTISIDEIENKITDRTKAIIVVHLYGQPVSMERILTLTNKYNLYLIEDCAQAHFAKYDGKYVGTFGNVGTFSFFPGKNLGAYGDAGAIVTNDNKLSKKMRMFANHGQLVKHEHIIEGINSRLDGMQAAILSVKLKHIKKWNSMRRNVAIYYSEMLSDIPQIELPIENNNSYHVYHLYVIKAENRSKLQKFLSDKGISTSIHYPTPLPLLEAYKYLQYNRSDFPKASKCQSKILSIPMFPELSKEQVRYIATNIRQFYKK